MMWKIAAYAFFAGGFALHGAELFQVDFKSEDSSLPPRSMAYRKGEKSELPTELPAGGRGVRITKEQMLELTFPDSSSNEVNAYFGDRQLETTGKVIIRFDAAVMEHTPPSNRSVETLFVIQLQSDHGRNLGVLSYVGGDGINNFMQWNPTSGAPTRLGNFTIGKRNRFELIISPETQTITIQIDDRKIVDALPFGKQLPLRYVRFGSGWALGGRDGAARVTIGSFAITDEADATGNTLPKITRGPMTPPGVGEWDRKTAKAELQGPYEDPAQQDIPFGKISYLLTPWRAYMDTQPATRYQKFPAVNWIDLSPQETEPTMQLLAEAGYRGIRVEINWGQLDFNDDAKLIPRELERLKMLLPLAQKYGIRPLILLNANAGAPCPKQTVQVELLADAPAGARELLLSSGFNPFLVGKTGLNGQVYQVACPLICALDTQADGTVKARLSAPLTHAVKAGKIELTELKYAPFSGDLFDDGTLNPMAQETVDGWVRYVATVTSTIRDLLGKSETGDAGFDVEVWNEYTFGSQFLWDWSYYQPARKFRSFPSYVVDGKNSVNGEHPSEIFLPLAVEYVNRPENRLPGVKVVSGFSNQRPWDNGSEMWPNQSGFSRHYYTNLDASDSWHDSRGLLSPVTESPDRLKGAPENAFIPTYRVSNIESPLMAIKTEFSIRDLQPFPGPFAGHFRYSHPGTGKPAEMWQTEYNSYRRPFAEYLEQVYGLSRGDSRLLPVLHQAAAKALSRSLIMYNHKGFDRLYFYATRAADDEFSILPEEYFRVLSRNRYQLNEETRKSAGIQLSLSRNISRLLDSGRKLANTRHLKVEKLLEHQPRLVFRGDKARNIPDRFHRDDFACLPFQLDESAYAIAYYVVTADLLHAWNPELDLLDPARYTMPEQQFDLTLGNLRGTGATLEIYDPIIDITTPLKAQAGTENTLTVSLPTVDYPRFLIVREKAKGPLILSPELRRTGENNAELTFASNVNGSATVTYGPFPERMGKTITISVRAGERNTVKLPDFPKEYAVRITLNSGKLTTLWPRWDHDVAGALEFRRTGGKAISPQYAIFKPEFANNAARVAELTPDAEWRKRNNVKLRFIAGDSETVAAQLPAISQSDRRRTVMTGIAGFPACWITYELDPTMHPGRKEKSLGCLVLPGAGGFWLLETEGMTDQNSLDEIIGHLTLK